MSSLAAIIFASRAPVSTNDKTLGVGLRDNDVLELEVLKDEVLDILDTVDGDVEPTVLIELISMGEVELKGVYAGSEAIPRAVDICIRFAKCGRRYRQEYPLGLERSGKHVYKRCEQYCRSGGDVRDMVSSSVLL